MSTEQERQEWRELAAAATPGEWFYRSQCIYGGIVLACVIPIRDNADADAAFIAAARTAVPALLADVDALTIALYDDAATKLGDAMLEAARLRAERDALAAELASYKRQAAYISACVDSDGCYRP